jgi:hypothetical protein
MEPLTKTNHLRLEINKTADEMGVALDCGFPDVAAIHARHLSSLTACLAGHLQNNREE